MKEGFSIRLKKMMLMKGLKGKELANHINVAPATITTYLTGRSEPPYDKLLAICEFFQCTPNDLILDVGATNLVAENSPSYGLSEVNHLKKEVRELKEENRILTNKLMNTQEKLIEFMRDKN